MKQEYAILSDIHGNSWALNAVLDDIQTKGIKCLINLGDIFYGPLDPGGTAKILNKYRMETVQGNEDRIIHETKVANLTNPTLRSVISQLSNQEKIWLWQLPKTKIIDKEIFLCHGTPGEDSKYLLEEIQHNLATLRSEAEIETLIRNIDCPVILCGHSHVAKTVRLPDGRIIVNAGSVGLPAYSDDSPQFHRMENGCPHAVYTILKKVKKGWNVEHIQIVYDWENAARRAEKNGRIDWAQWLKTGRA
ncbi:MAG: metallophosphatase family protein [Candidatus Aminicenantes bacterium]|jgi:predicted phosphodiesterase|nr:metallophosphatase family protein [Candidatus Aminicenantes bacterium]MDH5742522.1 metallophosphatase family protein [Candidatus Aminicenantes bacterium]